MAQTIIDVDGSKPIAETIQSPGVPMIILVGDFTQDCNDSVASIFQRAVVPVAVALNAVVVDDAKRSGCAAALAQAALGQVKPVQLIGIVPKTRDEAEIEPNHQQVYRLPADASNTPKAMFEVADQLAKKDSVANNVIVLLFGGGDDEKRFVVQCVRKGWPVLVVGKSGRLADQIVAATTKQPDGSLPPQPPDPDIREILDADALDILDIGEDIEEFQRRILSQLDSSTAVQTLAQAWQRFDDLDATALREQKWFSRIELSLIVLAVLSAFVSILSRVLGQPLPLHVTVIVVPIVISIVGAYNSHFRNGNKWILFRGAAEALKREIFRFQARAGAYSDEQCTKTSRESKLASNMKDILSGLSQSEVNKSSMKRGSKDPNDKTPRDRFLSREEYIQYRIEDQIAYFTKKTRRLSRQLIRRQTFIYVIGGVGTLLAALAFDVWVALATAVGTAFATKLQADQTENTLVQYNQTLASLRNILAWWNALSRWQKDRRKNIDLLVDQTEKAMEAETAGWVQQMQSALDKLTEKESDAATQKA
jgi:hypothetical protein